MDNIGIIDESKMTILRIINGVKVTTATRNMTDLQTVNETAAMTVSQIHGHGSTFIEFTVPESLAGANAILEIYDVRGSLVSRLSRAIGGHNNHLSWDETDLGGGRVGLGVYVALLMSGTARVSTKFSLVR